MSLIFFPSIRGRIKNPTKNGLFSPLAAASIPTIGQTSNNEEKNLMDFLTIIYKWPQNITLIYNNGFSWATFTFGDVVRGPNLRN